MYLIKRGYTIFLNNCIYVLYNPKGWLIETTSIFVSYRILKFSNEMYSICLQNLLNVRNCLRSDTAKNLNWTPKLCEERVKGSCLVQEIFLTIHMFCVC
jgi:hypothetical protein